MYILYIVTTITRPPKDVTVCRGRDVFISCGYGCASPLPVTWIINGTSFNQSQIMNSSMYQLYDAENPRNASLRVNSIDDTTTFKCIVHSTPTTTISTPGTVTVKRVCNNMHMYCNQCT